VLAMRSAVTIQADVIPGADPVASRHPTTPRKPAQVLRQPTDSPFVAVPPGASALFGALVCGSTTSSTDSRGYEGFSRSPGSLSQS